MPKITMEMMKGHTIWQKRDVAEAMCVTATHFFKVLPENILMRIDEIDAEDYFINGNACDDPRAQAACSSSEELFITLFYIEGRSVEVLRGFAKEMTKKLSALLSIPENGIFMHFVDMKKQELSRGGLLLCDM